MNKKKSNKKNKKKNTKKTPIGKKEYLFDVISLVIIILILLYFGIRSNYYYTKLNNKSTISNDLNTLILSSNPIKSSGAGLHQDKNGYYFYGNVKTNYVKYSNKLYRIVRINEDESISLITADNIANFMYNDNNYLNSNIYIWLNQIDSNVNNNNYTGVYINMLNDYKEKLVKTKYTIDAITKDNKISTGSESYEDYVSILSISDYIKAGSSKSYLNIGKYFYVLGQDSTGNNLLIDMDGEISTSDKTESYGVRAIITLKKDMVVSTGDGTLDNPYTIATSSNNTSDQYINLGNDTWKITYDDGDVLRLKLANYVKENDSDLLHIYSDESTLFNVNDKDSLAEYLNIDYYKTLSYADKLESCDNYVGEISEDAGYNYLNIYNDVNFSKVTIPNLFDYNNNEGLSYEKYPLINFKSSVNDMIYIYNNTGVVTETSITNENNVAAVICIKKDKIVGGNGTLSSPYTIE